VAFKQLSQGAGGSNVDNVVDLTGGRQAPIDDCGLSYIFDTAPSTNLGSIQLSGGDANLLSVVYHFNDGPSGDGLCIPIQSSNGDDQGVEGMCHGSAIGEINTGAYWTCTLPDQDMNASAWEDLCGDAITNGYR
jgi:hypothetical protein